MRNMPEKIYYLSSVRATLIGLILMLMGFGVSFIGFDVNQSFWQNFQSMVVDFRGVANFFTINNCVDKRSYRRWCLTVSFV
jgi:hypothetical protein